MTKRKAISTRTRFEVFKRDGFQCQYCGKHPPEVVLHVDHVLAVANGGGNERDNLVTACNTCNLGKSDVPLTSVPTSLKEKAAYVDEMEKQLAGYSQIFEKKRRRVEDDCWRVVGVLFPGVGSIPSHYFKSIKYFVEHMGVHGALDAADVAFCWGGCRGNDDRRFRYFCGVCWRVMRQSDSHHA